MNGFSFRFAPDESYLKAVQLGMIGPVKAELAKGADKDAKDSGQNSALHLLIRASAAQQEPHMRGLQRELLRFLCEEAKVDVNARDRYGMTPLMLAYEQSLPDVAEYLSGLPQADLSLRDNEGQSITHKAARNRHPFVKEPLLKLALETAPDLDVQDQYGQTMLHVLVQEENPLGLAAALLAGADPNIAGGRMQKLTPLEVSVIDKMGPEITSLLDVFSNLPVFMDISKLTHEDLTRAYNGKRMIDNPKVWRQMPRILDALEEKGEPLPDKKDLSQGGVLDYSPMSIALTTGQFASLERCLASHGQALEPQDFHDSENSSLGKFGEVAIQQGVLDELFTVERSIRRGSQATRRLYRDLPDECKEALTPLKYKMLLLETMAAEQEKYPGRTI